MTIQARFPCQVQLSICFIFLTLWSPDTSHFCLSECVIRTHKHNTLRCWYNSVTICWCRFIVMLQKEWHFLGRRVITVMKIILVRLPSCMNSCRWKDAASMFTTVNKALFDTISAKNLNSKNYENEENQGSTDWNCNSCSFKPDFVVTVACWSLCCSIEIQSVFTCVQYGTCNNANQRLTMW